MLGPHPNQAPGVLVGGFLPCWSVGLDTLGTRGGLAVTQGSPRAPPLPEDGETRVAEQLGRGKTSAQS